MQGRGGDGRQEIDKPSSSTRASERQTFDRDRQMYECVAWMKVAGGASTASGVHLRSMSPLQSRDIVATLDCALCT